MKGITTLLWIVIALLLVLLVIVLVSIDMPRWMSLLGNLTASISPFSSQ